MMWIHSSGLLDIQPPPGSVPNELPDVARDHAQLLAHHLSTEVPDPFVREPYYPSNPVVYVLVYQ